MSSRRKDVNRCQGCCDRVGRGAGGGEAFTFRVVPQRAHGARAARSDRTHQDRVDIVRPQQIRQLRHVGNHVLQPAVAHEGVVVFCD